MNSIDSATCLRPITRSGPSKIRVNALLLSLAVWISTANGATYHVAPSGSDKNDGESWGTAWGSLQYAADSAMPGDTVLVRGGDAYQPFVIRRSGTMTHPITFKGESRISPPVITGGVQQRDWTKTTIAGIWRIDTSAEPAVLLSKGEPLQKASSRFCIDGRWYWEKDVLYYRAGGPSPTDDKVTRAARGHGILLKNREWIAIENMQCRIGNGACVSIKGGANNLLRNVQSSWYVRGIEIDHSHHNKVFGSFLENNREGIYLLNDSDHNEIVGNTAIHNGNVPAWTRGDRAGIAIGELGYSKHNLIKENRVELNGGPQSDPGLIAYQAPNTILENNYVTRNYSGGILVGVFSHDSIIRENRVIRNGQPAFKRGLGNIPALSIRRSRGVSVTHNEVIDNFVTLSDKDRYIDRKSGGIDVKGNPSDAMPGILISHNYICGTVNGLDLYVSAIPNLAGLEFHSNSTTPVNNGPCLVTENRPQDIPK